MSNSQRRGSVTAEGPALPSQRRASVPQGGAGAPFQQGHLRRGSKMTFLGAGRRVSLMVKYKKALQGPRGKGAAREGEAEEPNPMEPIRELPHSPRFSTFLSPEAQFAMMKGYEDKLYDRITDCKPEVRSSLQRTKTPFQIAIADQDCTHLREEDEEEGEGEGQVERGEKEGGKGQTREVKSPTLTSSSTSYSTSPSATNSGYHSGLPASTTRRLSVSTEVMKSLDNGNSNHRSLSPESTSIPIATTPTTPTSIPTTTISVPYLKPLRRRSVAGNAPTDVNGNGMMTNTTMMHSTSPLESSLDNLHLHRSYSLPSLDHPRAGGDARLTMSKRLVLTYRLESAMDLLDTLKKTDPIAEEGEAGGKGGRREGQSLSPRILRGQSHLQQAGDPVKDFNAWTKVWNKEFKEVQSK